MSTDYVSTPIDEDLNAILKTLETRGDGFQGGWNDPAFLENEWKWREDRSPFLEWLRSDEPDLERSWWTFFHGRFGNSSAREISFEEGSLTKAWKGASIETRRGVWEALRQAMDCQRVPKEPAAAEDAAGAYFQALKKLSETDGLDRVACRNVETAWSIRTVPLSSAAPAVFPFIIANPMKGEVARRLFGSIYRIPSQANLEEYMQMCQAFQKLSDALQRSTEFGPLETPDVARRTAAWLVEVTARWDRPEYLATALLCRGGNVILQGPPGTGKTFHADRIGKQLLKKAPEAPTTDEKNEKNSSADIRRIMPFAMWVDAPEEVKERAELVTEFVQFHASYDYEDFVRGYRPHASGDGMAFSLEDGPFAAMATAGIEAQQKGQGTRFLLVIDEINRADLARVLGECVYLLDRRIAVDDAEAVERGEKAGAVRLRYTKKAGGDDGPALRTTLWLPDNVYVLGTMNTADRSIAVVDHALRRRFHFVDVTPNEKLVADHWSDQKLKERNQKLSKKERISLEELLVFFDKLNGFTNETDARIPDPRYRIGHSYFMKDSIQELEDAMRYQVLPLLEEYREDGQLKVNDDQWDEMVRALRMQ